MSPLRIISCILATMLALNLAASKPSCAQTKTDFDKSYAVIYVYFAVGDNSSPSSSVTTEQFSDHVDELTNGHYTIKPLPEIVDAFIAKKDLPENTIAITFDGADKSIFEVAAPILIKKNIPFTIFVPSEKISNDDSSLLSWHNLDDLKKTGLVNFGIHPAAYTSITNQTSQEIKRQINNDLIALRDNLGVSSKIFAYPFGEYNEEYQATLRSMGIKAAFGQQSGVAYAASNMLSLPRFTMTENFADMDRFLMTANALPMPANDISPASPFLKTMSPVIGFTLSEQFTQKDIKSIKCFSSSDDKPNISFLDNRVEIRIKNITDERPRINCTMPYESFGDDAPRWRWLGFLFSAPDSLLLGQK